MIHKSLEMIKTSPKIFVFNLVEFFSTKNLSFTPLRAVATHTHVIVIQINLQ
jgi:hypothetical protein